MRRVSSVLVGGLVAASLVVLVGCQAAPQSAPEAVATTTPQPVASAQATPSAPVGSADNPARVAIVGDSLTAGGARMLSQGLTPDTWMTYADGDGVDFVGGWAQGGTTVQYEAAHVQPVRDVDVLVLMAGTNDVRLHLSFAQSAASYDSIVATIHPKHVVIAAIPPYDHNPDAAAVYEKQLRAYVATKDWEFVDPWGFARDGKFYAAGVSNDGTHPTTAGYEKLGANLHAAILRVVSTPVAG